MKKVFGLLLVAGVMTFTSCGGGAKKADEKPVESTPVEPTEPQEQMNMNNGSSDMPPVQPSDSSMNGNPSGMQEKPHNGSMDHKPSEHTNPKK